MKRVLAIAMVLVGTARADRRSAEQLLKEAEAEHDPAKFEACGNAYLDIVNADPGSPSNDEPLYNAALCFTGAHSVGAADNMLRQLVTRYPNSKLASRALVRIAEIAEATGRFDEAATRLEAYARKYAGEKDASDALANAFGYRVMLEDNAKAIDDASYYVRTFGVKRRTEAAAMMLRLVPIHEKTGDAIPFVEGLVKDFDKGLDDAQLVVAMAKLAELKWDATCKGRALCITELPPDKLQRCGDGVRVRVDKRSSTTDAVATLAAAARLYEQRQPKDEAARHAYAMTKLRIADRALEAYLADPFPGGLDFSPRAKAKSLERFNHYIQDKVRLGGEAEKLYGEVLAIRDADASIAAVARMGQSSARFAASLRTAEVPLDVRTGDLAKEKIEAFCSRMIEVAEPLASRALEAFRMCLQKSQELSVDTAWTVVCRREASALDPKLVVDEPQLGALVPIHPAPWYVAAPRPALGDAGYAAAFAEAEKTACPKLATPTSDAGRYLAALVAARCGNLEDARRGFAALAMPAAIASLGSVYWNTGNASAAIDAWQVAVKGDPKLAVAHYGLALAHFADPGRDSDTERALISASVVEPAQVAPRVMLALLALRRGRPQIALFYLSRIETQTPASLVARALVRWRGGRWADAAAPLEEAEKERWPQASYDLALVALRRHDYADALARLRNVKPGYEALVARGVAHAGAGKHAEAREAFDAAIRIDAARSEAHFDLGLDLAAQAKFHEAAGELDLAKATALADRYRKLP